MIEERDEIHGAVDDIDGELREIIAAETRLADGRYGTCEVCAQPISDGGSAPSRGPGAASPMRTARALAATDDAEDAAAVRGARPVTVAGSQFDPHTTTTTRSPGSGRYAPDRIAANAAAPPGSTTRRRSPTAPAERR